MPNIDIQKKRITSKIVYYGAGLSGKSASLRYIYEHLDSDDQISGLVIPIAKYPSLLKMMQTGEPVLISDTSGDSNWTPLEGRREWRRSYVAAPIRLKDSTVGFLNVNGIRPGQFSPPDAQRLKAFASHAAAAIENAQLYRKLHAYGPREEPDLG